MKAATLATAENIITLTVEPKPKAPPVPSSGRFKVIQFIRPRTGETSWRVTGIKRDGTRVRQNFRLEEDATKHRVALEAEYYTRSESQSSLKATKLTDDQLRIAESIFPRLKDDAELYRAVDYWLMHGRQQSADVESERLDEAVKKFKEWVEAAPELRKRTKGKLKSRINLFANSVPNLPVADISADVIESFFAKRDKVSPATRKGDHEAISRFFSWCIERPRRWAKVNPCREIKINTNGDKPPPAILTVEECRKMLRAAEAHREGHLAAYVAACLFGALRPAEVARLSWDKVNLKDGEILIESQSSKVKRARLVKMDKPLKAWLKAYKDKPLRPSNLRRDLDKIKQAAGYTGRASGKDKLRPWPEDALRHTGISHYFRRCGSYGLTAEWAGNSEAVIKKHYQGRVTSEDTEKFYRLMPKRGGRK